VVLEGTEEKLLEYRRPPPASRPCRHLVVGVTGAINAVHVVSMLPHLHRHFCDRLDVIFTESALQFVNPKALDYFGIGCWSDAFAARGDVKVPHIHLARSAELVVVMPASASSLQRLASGACSDLLSLLVAATRAPVAVAPSMNNAMWTNPAVQRNVQQLRADGVHLIEPALAFEVSDGQAAEPEHGGMGVSAATVVETLRALLPVRARPRPVAARGRRSRR
jgi:phosphopantothenoylcysteine synthetase/decarboxylase